MYCRNCSKEIPDDSRFCSYCRAEQGVTGSGVSIHAGGDYAGRDMYKHVKAGDVVGPGPVIVLKQYEIETVNRLFADLNSQLRSVPDISEDKRNEAISKSEELNKEIIKEKPELGKIEQLKGWLIYNVPEVAGAVISLFAGPIIGKVVEKAGKMISERVK